MLTSLCIECNAEYDHGWVIGILSQEENSLFLPTCVNLIFINYANSWLFLCAKLSSSIIIVQSSFRNYLQAVVLCFLSSDASFPTSIKFVCQLSIYFQLFRVTKCFSAPTEVYFFLQ